MAMLSDIYSQIQEEDIARGAAVARGGLPAIAYAGSSMLGRGIGELFGVEDQRVTQAKQMQEAMQGMDFSDPANMYAMSSKFLQLGDYDRAMKFAELASQAEYRRSSVLADALKAAKGKEYAVPNMSDADEKRVKKILKSVFDVSWYDSWEDKLPGGMDLDVFKDEVWTVSNRENISIKEAAESLKAEIERRPELTETKPAGPTKVKPLEF